MSNLLLKSDNTPPPQVFMYCDESCHLPNDHQKSMVLGAIWCPGNQRQRLGRAVKALKKKHCIGPGIEIKWTKVSPGQLDFYLALIDLFFTESDLRFRAVVIPDKDALNHEAFNQSHDIFYYKMWYQLLIQVIDNQHRFRIYLDTKDTGGKHRIEKLHEVLCNSKLDFKKNVIQEITLLHSHEVPLLQLADMLIGAVSYVNRGMSSSPAKQALVESIRQKTGCSLNTSTLLHEDKFNLFVWRSREPMP
ncbi:MAG: DUF3800 domain-containing protein [Acidimicrobiaceae bacterium]|nr:DUF3800 domain-containing protein [Acidimicrobiaceae bacterium]